jgi:hypothetical protein
LPLQSIGKIKPVDPAGLRVTLDTGGRTEVVTAAYVLGAGGGHSVTLERPMAVDTWSPT